MKAAATFALALIAILVLAPHAAFAADKVRLAGGAGYGTPEGAAAACSRELYKGQKRIAVEDSCVVVRREGNGVRSCALEMGPNSNDEVRARLLQLCKTTALPE